MTGYRRIDCAVSSRSDGGLHIDVEVPAHLSASVGAFLAARKVKVGR
jgi:hypothetical protein